MTPWTVTHQAPLSVGFSRQDIGLGCHFLLKKIFLTQGSNPCLLARGFFTIDLPGNFLGKPTPLYNLEKYLHLKSSPISTVSSRMTSLIIIPLKLLLLLSHFSRVRLCATPQKAAHESPPSLGFSRQEHWSGLPFPSPMHENEK